MHDEPLEDLELIEDQPAGDRIGGPIPRSRGLMT